MTQEHDTHANQARPTGWTGEDSRPNHFLDDLLLKLHLNKPADGYSRDEIAQIAVKLTAAGCTNKRGRPGKRDRPLGPILKMMMSPQYVDPMDIAAQSTSPEQTHVA